MPSITLRSVIILATTLALGLLNDSAMWSRFASNEATPFLAQASADDDDGDDDDDGGWDDDDDDDDDRPRSWRRSDRRQSLQRGNIVRADPMSRPREIVAFGLSDDGLRRLSARGYRVLGRRELLSSGATLYRLSIPRRTFVDRAVEAVRSLEPGAIVDRNSL